MSAIYIQNHDIGRLVLRYDPRTGDHVELDRSTLPTDYERARGFYVYAGGHFTGVYASPTGPICFHDHARFALADAEYHADQATSATSGMFQLCRGSETLFHATYVPPRPSATPIWPDDEEEFSDFFVWLRNNLSDPRFFQYYTLSDSPDGQKADR